MEPRKEDFKEPSADGGEKTDAFAFGGDQRQPELGWLGLTCRKLRERGGECPQSVAYDRAVSCLDGLPSLSMLRNLPVLWMVWCYLDWYIVGTSKGWGFRASFCKESQVTVTMLWEGSFLSAANFGINVSLELLLSTGSVNHRWFLLTLLCEEGLSNEEKIPEGKEEQGLRHRNQRAKSQGWSWERSTTIQCQLPSSVVERLLCMQKNARKDGLWAVVKDLTGELPGTRKVTGSQLELSS